VIEVTAVRLPALVSESAAAITLIGRAELDRAALWSMRWPRRRA